MQTCLLRPDRNGDAFAPLAAAAMARYMEQSPSTFRFLEFTRHPEPANEGCYLPARPDEDRAL